MAGMLSSAAFNPEADDPAQAATPARDPAKDMYHDYLTNPNSTYGQDPTLAGQLKSATAPGVTPGSLTGSPDQVAMKGLTKSAFSQVYGDPAATAAKPDPLKEIAGDPRFGMTRYNGQDVITSQNFKDMIAASAKLAGMDPMEYDKMGNPNTYGARWGIPDPKGGDANSDGTLPGAGTPGSTPVMRGYTAAQTEVTPGMLVSGNLAQIMDPNNPLMVQAATQGNQQANKRGLQNSSIGISAAQDSMYKAALPIAQQDAGTQANVALSNTGAKNSSSQFNAGAANTAALTTQQLASQQTIAKMNNDTSIAVSKMNAETQAEMAKISQANQKVLQSNSQAATAMANYAATVANIQASKDMDAYAKQAAVNTQLTNLRNTLAALESQSGQNLEQYFPMLATEIGDGTTVAGDPKYDDLIASFF